jgi:hypothetical protein
MLTAAVVQFRTRNTSGVTRTDQNGACNLRNRSRLDTLPTVFGPDNASAPDASP